MLIAETLWSSAARNTASVVQVTILLVALWRAPWQLVLHTPTRSHLLFGAAVALMLLWRSSGPVAPQVELHLLGMTTVTLLLGLPLALIVGTASSVALAVVGWLPWSTALAHALINTALPAFVTSAVLHLVVRYGPRNLFMYMLGVGFLGGGLSMLATLLATMGLLAAAGHADIMQEWYSVVVLLAMFPEGFLNGAIVTSLAVYRPDWLKTFDDHHYLDGT